MAEPRPGARTGFTLLELLFVMAILGLVLGLGLGAFSSLGTAEKAAVAKVQTSLRAANNWAVARQAPARVRLDVQRGALLAEGMQPIGTWHFEELPIVGAFDLGGASEGAELVADGWQGSALSFTRGGPGARVLVPVHKDPAYDLREGFSVRLRLRREAPGGGRVFDLGGVVRLETDEAGRVQAEFDSLAVDELGVERAGGTNRLRTPPGVVQRGEWTLIAVDYDRERFRILVEDILVSSLEQDAPVAAVDRGLEFGGTQRPFPGSIDGFVVHAVGGDEEETLGDGVRFGEGTPREIRFAPGGGLDRARHTEPARVRLEFDGGRARTISVSLLGTVQG